MATQRRLLAKRLKYLDVSGASQDEHAAHWRGFRFTAGPWMVRLVGPWGKPEVWASTFEEGKRVLLHAAAIASWDMSGDDWEWQAAQVRNPRYGRECTVALMKRRGTEMVSKRGGPSGAPIESLPP